jgi:hypothetical protein
MPQTGVPVTQEQLTETKRADIERLLRPTTVPILQRLASDIAVTDVTDSLKAVIPDLPEAGRKSAIDETNLVLAEFANDFIKEIVPAYNSLFSHSEIKEMLAFYETPIGRKMLSAATSLESMAKSAAQKSIDPLYPRLTQRVISRLQKEGFMTR